MGEQAEGARQEGQEAGMVDCVAGLEVTVRVSGASWVVRGWETAHAKEAPLHETLPNAMRTEWQGPRWVLEGH